MLGRSHYCHAIYLIDGRVLHTPLGHWTGATVCVALALPDGSFIEFLLCMQGGKIH